MKICIVNCFDTYEHRVDLLLNTFKSLGHKAIVLTSDFRHIEKTKRNEKKSGYKFFRTEPYSKNLSFKRIKSHRHFSRDVSNYIKSNIEKIDLIWALIPPNSLVKDLSRIKVKYPKVKLIYDLIDLWPETMPVKKIKEFFPFTYWRDLRDKYINKADYIVTECNLYQNKLKKILSASKVKTLFFSRPYEKYKPDLHLPNDKIALCYLGSVNNIIDIDTIVNIVKTFQMTKPVKLHIIGDGEKRERLITKVKATGADVIYHGKIYDRQKKQFIFDGCHFGLNIMKSSVCVGLTMKSIDYFEFGLPIINNIKGDTWNIVESANIGFNWNENTNTKMFSEYPLNLRKEVRLYFENNLTDTTFKKNISDILLFVKGSAVNVK